MGILWIPILFYCKYTNGKANDYSFGLIKETGISSFLRKKDWKNFDKVVLEQSAGNLTRILDGLCLTGYFDKKIKEYTNNHESEVSYLVSGVFNTYVAWQIRSAKRAKEVKSEQWEGFYKHLEKAKTQLDRVTKNSALVTEAQARLIKIHMGLNERGLAEKSFKNCVALNDKHFLGHFHYFKLLTPKWGGEIGEMKSFIASISNKELKQLFFLMYFIELYSDLSHEDYESADMIFESRYGSDVRELLNTLITPVSDKIVSIYTSNYLSYLFNIIGDEKSRDDEMKKIKGKYTFYPWAYFGMPCERDVKLFKLAKIL